MRRALGTALAAALMVALVPAAAHARDAKVTSFDGTVINTHFFPAKGLKPGEKAPTILQGPGWSMSGETESMGAQSVAGSFGVTSIGGIIAAGYNVVTWDPRGFGQSGGTVQIDDPRYEGRDVQALLDFVTRQPEAQLDVDCSQFRKKAKKRKKPQAAKKRKRKVKRICKTTDGDPRAGMAGGSYGGGIQLVSAAIDKRIDAIVPSIAWHSLLTSIFPESNVKTGWGSILVAAGAQGSLQGGGSNPSAAPGRQDPHFYSLVTNGVATGKIPQSDLDWMASKGPADLVKRIRIPTLLIQGTVDTLFPLDEAVTNFNLIRRNTLRQTIAKGKKHKKGKRKRRKGRTVESNVPVKMIWFCGGHGACFTGSGPADYTMKRTIAWFDRYLKDQKSADTGPLFAWIADDGQVRSSREFPLKDAGKVIGAGSGTLPIAPGQGSGGSIFASASPNALNIPIPGPSAPANVVGAPKLRMTYTGNAVPQDTWVYAQILNPRSGTILGNMATPIPVKLDGQTRDISRELEMVAARAPASGGFTLQLVASSTIYDIQRSTGSIDFTGVDLTLPLGEPADPGPDKAKRKKKKKRKRKKR